MSTVIQLAIVLGIMVLVHEFGHFAAAKLCGVRVETFSVGMGKRLFGFRHGDTDYRLSILPIGGYVKMAGDTPGEPTTGDPGEFNAHPRWQRVIIALAGPVANFILAFALMTGVSMLHNEVQEYIDGPAQTDYVPASSRVAHTGIYSGDLIVHYDTIENPTWDQVLIRSLLNLNRDVPFSFLHDGQRTDTTLFVESKEGAENFSPGKLGLIPRAQNTPVQVAELDPDMPAAHAGLQPKDEIATIDGLQLHSVDALLSYLQDQAGKPAALSILRPGVNGAPAQTLSVQLTPQLAKSSDGTDRYRIGFLPVQPPVKVEKLPLGKAMAASWKVNLKYASLIVEVVKGMFTRHVSVRNLSGPIGIGQQVHQAVEMPGWMPIIGLMAYISINLGIFNLLPFPILDGGMISFLAIESIIRRDINQEIKERIMQVALVCLLIFGALVIFNDLSKLTIFSKLKL
ncbi:RIP metalloprotease RseP [Granulicella arctica]|uniref:Zinc metalloprotease n=1 Tax=Granulicella arctica TaxID=940613 RepID=A0A7Y9PGU2_9BACT|nr:RIP metalloprotease RseP [Granulicella arctica]NYF79643.1 regulator of sigma E protease [Granulicella arctica]